LALKSDGSVVAWGRASNGATSVPPGLTNVTRISAGTDHSLALTAAGDVVAWGSSPSYGVEAVPAVLNLRDVVAIAAGTQHNLVLVPAEAPVIRAQPESRVFMAGSAIRIDVAASGTPPLGYTWRRNGSVVTSGVTNRGATL